MVPCVCSLYRVELGGEEGSSLAHGALPQGTTGMKDFT